MTRMVDLMEQVKFRKKISPNKNKDKDKDKKKEDTKIKKSLAKKKDGMIYNIFGKPGELARNCPLKKYIHFKKWY